MTATLLLTRPEAQSREFLARCEALAGAPLAAVISPLAEPEATGMAIPAEGDLILTSGRAAEAAGLALAGRRAWCVGARTAALAAGFGAEAVDGGGDADALVARVLESAPAPLVHLRGQHVRGDVAGRLARAGRVVSEVQVYRSDDRPLSPAALDLLRSGRAVVAPVFSPRTAMLLVQGAPLTRAHAMAAISPAAAQPFRDGDARVEVAERPDADSLARLVLRLTGNLP